MPIDLSKIKKKLNPPMDGQDVLRLRVGVVTAVNGDGTCDVVLSGTTIEDVPRLQEASVQVGGVVQILSYRGSLLIIGRSATGGQTAGLGLWARGASTSQSSDITSTTPVSTGLATNTVTFVKDRVYECRTHGGVTNITANTYADLRPFRNTGTQLGEWYRFPTPVTAVFNATAGGIYFTPTASVSGSVVLYAATSAGTLNHYANGGTPRTIEVWDVGDISQFPGIPTW